jgi:7,8-dihydroneopterin aldolase/epimerase/oxygenase
LRCVAPSARRTGDNRVITVEVRDLRVFGRHGVHEAERERGQDFLFDVELEVGERGASDRLEDAVDYVEVARAVREVSDARTYALLEALASAVADELERRFAPERVRVRVRKPEVRPAGLEGTVAAAVTRP